MKKTNVKKKHKMHILYEDKHLLVVEKPAHLLTIATDNEKFKTMYHEVLEYLQKKNQKVFIVHRLDKDTSGLIIFAKSKMIQQMFQNDWDHLMIKRGYVSVVEKKVNKNKGTLISFLKENNNFTSYSVNDEQHGKKAVTKYQVIQTNNNYSLLDLVILTGRKNQIRVQLQENIGAIVGDKKYGAKKNPLKRLCLCANEIIFIHPITKETINLKIEIPKEFLTLFK